MQNGGIYGSNEWQKDRMRDGIKGLTVSGVVLMSWYHHHLEWKGKKKIASRHFKAPIKVFKIRDKRDLN